LGKGGMFDPESLKRLMVIRGNFEKVLRGDVKQEQNALFVEKLPKEHNNNM
jgi:hypothetical protein